MSDWRALDMWSPIALPLGELSVSLPLNSFLTTSFITHEFHVVAIWSSVWSVSPINVRPLNSYENTPCSVYFITKDGSVWFLKVPIWITDAKFSPINLTLLRRRLIFSSVFGNTAAKSSTLTGIIYTCWKKTRSFGFYLCWKLHSPNQFGLESMDHRLLVRNLKHQLYCRGHTYALFWHMLISKWVQEWNF